MKKIIKSISIALAFLCAAAPLFTSCSKDKDAEIDLPAEENIQKTADADFSYTSSDDKPYVYNMRETDGMIALDEGYIYYEAFLREDDGSVAKTILKLDPETGVTSACCKAPSCSHGNSDCPLYGRVGAFYVNDGKILFNRHFERSAQDAEGKRKGIELVFDEACYDTNTDTLTVIEKHDGVSPTQSFNMLSVDDYCYYYDYRTLDEDSEEYRSFCEENGYMPKFVDLSKLDMNTYEKAAISDKPSLMNPTEKFCFALNGRIYFTDGKRLYSRDMNNENEIEHCTGAFGNEVYTDGESVYFALNRENTGDGNVKDVYRLRDMSDYSSREKIIESCSRWFLTENYIYYADASVRTADRLIFNTSEIRRCGHDGGNDETVFRYEGDYAAWQLSGIVIYGNYIYATFYYYFDDNSDGVIDPKNEYHDLADSLARIDVNTGEVYIIKNNRK